MLPKEWDLQDLVNALYLERTDESQLYGHYAVVFSNLLFKCRLIQ